MSYEFINRQVLGDHIYYDCVLLGNGWDKRVNVKMDNDLDMDSVGNSLFEAGEREFKNAKNKNEILNVIDSMEVAMLNQIESGTMDLSKILSINVLLNQYLAQIGLHLDTPDMKTIIRERMLNTVSIVRNLYKGIEVTDQIKTLSYQLISQLQ